MQPFNYRQQVVNPFEQAIQGAAQGFQLGTNIRAVQEQRQAAMLAQQQQEELQRKLTRLQQNPNPTFVDYEEIAMFLPKDAAESLRKNYEARTQESKQNAQRFSGQVVAALASPNEEARKRGIELLRQRAEAERNAGNTQDAEAYELHAKIAETGPDGAKAVVDEVMVMGATTFGKDWAEGILKVRAEPKEGFRPITTEERKRFELPANVSFQVGPDGKIMPITKEPLVTISGPLVGAENKYAETVGTETAREDVEAVKAANKGVGDLSKINRTLNQLYTSKAITGIGADMLNTVEKLKARLGSDVAAGKVADTELLDALLGADVFPQIGALGIGARGLDTPAEREFLRSVMTGTISMNKETLIRMTEIRRDIQEEAIKQYNEKLERGELDRYFEITRRQKRPLPLTEEQERRIERRRAGIIDARPQPGRRPGVAPFTPSPVPSAIEQAVDRSLRSRADAIIRGQ